MSGRCLIDAGPIVALLNSQDQHHEWAVAQTKQCSAPFATCEAVISESFHLLEHTHDGCSRLVALLERGFLRIDFAVNDQLPGVAKLLRRYADLPISLADACLVRMTELDERASVFTLDRDFLVYRKNSRQVISVLLPPG